MDNYDIDHDALEDDDDDAPLCTEGDVHWAGRVESKPRVGCPFPLRLPPLDPEERGLGWWQCLKNIFTVLHIWVVTRYSNI